VRGKLFNVAFEIVHRSDGLTIEFKEDIAVAKTGSLASVWWSERGPTA